MPRPSQGIDQALLRSGLALWPQSGCAGLSVRKVAEHAGVNPAMFHYHFGSKGAFLEAVLQQVYEQMFSQLSASAARDGPVLGRLEDALLTLARFVREHHALLARLAIDAAHGETVVQQFLRTNAPRHLTLLLQLLGEAESAGLLIPAPPMQRFVFLMGSVAAPMLMVQAMAALGVAPAAAMGAAQALSDDAIRQRVQWALAALVQRPPASEISTTTPPATPRRRATTRSRTRP
ncbi:TetR family transcriptional regulator [Ideonella sp. DXS29W]|uniref:TetR family transcriptional regulator n=1 Tax=Ideonella lacteola TaxID=2984193 RepID=A0ABU9BVV5_9BURK